MLLAVSRDTPSETSRFREPSMADFRSSSKDRLLARPRLSVFCLSASLAVPKRGPKAALQQHRLL